MSKLKEKLMLSEKGYSDLKKAITACTITNIALLLPSMVACLLFWELLKPFTGETISWAALWKLLGLGLVAAILVFLAAKNDYRKTYIASYKEASTTRLRIAEHLRKLPMSFFNTKDLSDITTNMMADCSSMESMLSSTIPVSYTHLYSQIENCTESVEYQRIYSRIIEMCIPVMVIGEDFRKVIQKDKLNRNKNRLLNGGERT